MERLENLQRDYLRLTEKVRVSLQIHVGDVAGYRRLQKDVLDFLDAARQVSHVLWQSSAGRLIPLSPQNRDVIADNDFLSLQVSASTMLECLQNAENEATDPPAPGLPVSRRVKGRVGRPRVEIDKNYLEAALQVRGPHQLANVLGCNPRTIRRRALEYGLADPAPPVFQTTRDPDGTVSQSWFSSSTPARSLIAEDPNALDDVVGDVLLTFPQMGRQKLDGVLKARGYRIPRERLRESYVRVHGAPARFAKPRIERRTYYVPAPNSLWHHDGNHSTWLAYPGRCSLTMGQSRIDSLGNRLPCIR